MLNTHVYCMILYYKQESIAHLGLGMIFPAMGISITPPLNVDYSVTNL